MIVRIRLKKGRLIRRKPGKNRELASAFAALLIPAALMAYVLGFWRLASDMGMAGEFGIQGLFSHWQVWIVLAATLTITSSILNRYSRSGAMRVPRILQFRTPQFRRRLQAQPDDSESVGKAQNL
jgi:hypothetical protein